MKNSFLQRKTYGWLFACLCTLCLLSGCGGSASSSGVRLPAILSDGMVLQRERPLRIWGTASPGAIVEVTLHDQTQTAEADAQGQWSVTLAPMPAGGPYTLTAGDVEVRDVLVGDVFLCSGQSNMELPVGRVTDMFADEIAAYENPMIRHIKVPNTYNFESPQSDLQWAQWQPATSDHVMQFSALAYFMAKRLYEKTQVPIGLVNASWGGTPVEAWMSETALQPYPKYINEKRLYEDVAYCADIKTLEAKHFRQWNHALYLGDAGLHESAPWYAFDYDDSSWQEVDMFDSQSWGDGSFQTMTGSHWLRKTIDLPASWDGAAATLRLGCIVDADSVYVNGTFVGNITYQYPPRIYPIPEGLLRPGKNVVTVRIISNNGRPSFVPEKPYKLISHTDGAEVSLEGKWRYRQGAPMPPAPGMMFFCYKPVCLYNAMIAPLANYVFSGAVWYQGESNVGNRHEYADMLTAMMADWRQTFADPSLPFYIVELADFLHPDDVGGRQAWAEMRAIQAQAAARDAQAELIPNSDLGEWNDIHPLDKKTLANRVVEAILRTR